MREIITLKRETVDAFLRMREQDEISEQQKKIIRRHVEQFYAWLPVGKELSQELLSQWKNELQERLTASSAAQYITHVNQLLRFAGFGELCPLNYRACQLTGRRFGRLVAVEPIAGKRGKSRSVVWRCRCDCGRMTEATANSLQQGLRVSCGCQKREKLQDYNLYVDDTSLRQVFSDKIYKNNTSGSRGVYQSRGLWAANITYKKKKYFLGRYAKQEDAIRARKRAEAWIRDDAEQLLERLTAMAVQTAI